MLWVCGACTARYAATLDVCPHCGHDTGDRAPDHEVDQDGDEMSAKITGGGGPSVSFPHVRPGEDAPDPAEVEYAGREPEVGEAPVRPADSDNKAKWVAYADALDADTDHSALTKGELQDYTKELEPAAAPEEG